jgi:GT2 family glycosyltransferase
MFSVVIPTMWRSERIVEMLPLLDANDYVAEIIVIDNDKESRPDLPECKKMRLLEQEENIYVNPAWNLGVKEAKNESICILNDDVTFDVEEVFSAAARVLSDHPSSCLGVHPLSYKEYNDSIKVAEGSAIGQGWGCCIFLNKENWVEIPDQIKIWFGDNWIVKNHEKCFSAAFKIFTEMSTTSSMDSLNNVIKKDIQEWKKLL